MSSTIMIWTPEEEQRLTRVQCRMQAASPERTVSRPDVVRALLLAADIGAAVDAVVMRPTIPSPSPDGSE